MPTEILDRRIVVLYIFKLSGQFKQFLSASLSNSSKNHLTFPTQSLTYYVFVRRI